MEWRNRARFIIEKRVKNAADAVGTQRQAAGARNRLIICRLMGRYAWMLPGGVEGPNEARAR